MVDQTLYLTGWGTYFEVTDEYYEDCYETNYSYYCTNTYTMDNPTRTGIVTNVRVSFDGYARPTYNGHQDGKTAIYSSGRSLVFGSAHALSMYPGSTYYTDYALNPWTGVGWTWDDIDALEAGFSLISDSGTSYAGSDSTALALIVTSVPSSPGGCGQIIGFGGW